MIWDLRERARVVANDLISSLGWDSPANSRDEQVEREGARALASRASLRIAKLERRIEVLEAWLAAEVDDHLGPEDEVRHLLSEHETTCSVKRASRIGGVQFHRLDADREPALDPFLGSNEERDRLAYAFEALRRLDVEVRDRASKIFVVHGLGNHGFTASVTFTYVPEWDKAKREE